jgi:transcription antitermination factor NusG
VTNAQRAKQFASGFDPLSGYQEALRESEKVDIPHAELSEDRKAELDYTVTTMSPGTMVKVIYYKEGSYIKFTGMISKIDCQEKKIRVVDRDIPIKDIYDISKEG